MKSSSEFSYNIYLSGHVCGISKEAILTMRAILVTIFCDSVACMCSLKDISIITRAMFDLCQTSVVIIEAAGIRQLWKKQPQQSRPDKGTSSQGKDDNDDTDKDHFICRVETRMPNWRQKFNCKLVLILPQDNWRVDKYFFLLKKTN